jgi:hypothetical protein
MDLFKPFNNHDREGESRLQFHANRVWFECPNIQTHHSRHKYSTIANNRCYSTHGYWELTGRLLFYVAHYGPTLIQTSVDSSSDDRSCNRPCREEQSWVQNTGLLVEWRPNDPFDDDDDLDYVYEGTDDDDQYDDDTYDDTMSTDHTVNISNVSDANAASIDEHYDDNSTVMDVPTEVPLEIPTYNEPNLFVEVDDVNSTQPEVADIFQEDEFPPKATVTEPAVAPRYDLRPSRHRSYDHCLAHQMDDRTDSKSYGPPTKLLQRSTNQVVTAYIMTQMSAASGIKTYGQPAIDAIHKEFCQLH